MELCIRQAQAQDAPAIAELLRGLGLFSWAATETPPVTAERVARHLAWCAADASHSVFVACDPAGVILGYGAVHWLPYLMLVGPEGYVSELFVQEPHRGQGVGGQLLEVIIAAARERGCARLMLLNQRRRESYQRRFYAKHGWEERETMANFVYYL